MLRCRKYALGLRNVHNLFESFPKLRIEDCVDDRVHKTVHVAQPRCQNECSHAGLARWLEFRAHCIHNVACKKWHPAYQKYTWKRKIGRKFHILVSFAWQKHKTMTENKTVGKILNSRVRFMCLFFCATHSSIYSIIVSFAMVHFFHKLSFNWIFVLCCML